MSDRKPATAGACLLALSILITGCSHPQPQTPVTLAQPVIKPDAPMKQGPTLLERFEEVSRLYQMERESREALEARLEDETRKCGELESELKQLRQRVAALPEEAAELDELRGLHETAQKELLKLTAQVRELRTQLYEESIARVKQEQTIVALRIAQVKARRGEILRNNESPENAAEPEEKDDDEAVQ